jgi:fructokinase
MILVIGEILFDNFPDFRRIGGAPFNFAYHLRQMGFPVRFFTRVGDDADGRQAAAFVTDSGFDPGDVQIDSHRPTGTVRVDSDPDGAPRFDITADVAYDAIALTPALMTAIEKGPDLFYYGTLIQRSGPSRDALQAVWRRVKPETRCFYDMNLRPGGYDREAIERSLTHADILKLNDEELDRVKTLFGDRETEAEAVAALTARFDLSVVAVTRGGAGSSLYVGGERHETAAAGIGRIADSVGAGDAYAAMLAAGLLLGWYPARTLSAAADFSARICTIRGAIPPDDRFYGPIRRHINKER